MSTKKSHKRSGATGRPGRRMRPTGLIAIGIVIGLILGGFFGYHMGVGGVSLGGASSERTDEYGRSPGDPHYGHDHP